eukprot:1407421-Pyramimonas_sp.AAC.1
MTAGEGRVAAARHRPSGAEARYGEPFLYSSRGFRQDAPASEYPSTPPLHPLYTKPRSRRPKKPSAKKDSRRLSTLVYHSAHVIWNVPPNIQ